MKCAARGNPAPEKCSCCTSRFLLLGWVVCVAAPLGDRGHPDPWVLLPVFLLLWHGCRLVPWRGLALGAGLLAG